VLSLQLLAALEAAPDPSPGGGRGVHRELDGVGGGLQRIAQLLEVVLALIRLHTPAAQRAIQRKAKAGRPPPPLQRSAGCCPEGGHSGSGLPCATQDRSAPGPAPPSAQR